MPSLTARLNVIEKLHILSAPAAMPSNWNTSGHPTTTQGIREVVRKALPNQAPTETDYVDSYLFGTGYFESWEE